jgi:hypothetical protein
MDATRLGGLRFRAPFVRYGDRDPESFGSFSAYKSDKDRWRVKPAGRPSSDDD